MGRILSKTYPENLAIDGVLLGQPTIVTATGEPFAPGDSLSELWFCWDDPRIPDQVLPE